MSSFIVDKAHIDLIVKGLTEGTRGANPLGKKFARRNKNAMGQSLVQANRNSVGDEYPHLHEILQRGDRPSSGGGGIASS